MGAGDVTILGPYALNAVGMAAMETAVELLATTDGASDTNAFLTAANGREFWFVNIEGA